MYGQEQLLKYKNIKAYLVRFINKETGERFFKFGVTGKYDAAERFTDEEYNLWDIKVMTTVYGPTLEILELEQEMLQRYPKNFYLHEKIKGVTEIFKVERVDENKMVGEVKAYFAKKGTAWYSARKGLATAN
jgi:hypothetical protein